MAHLVKHFRLVHDTTPFVLFQFYNLEVVECHVQRPTLRAVGSLRPAAGLVVDGSNIGVQEARRLLQRVHSQNMVVFTRLVR